MPSWCSLPPIATACGCESVTACYASISSPSSTTLRSPPITTLPSAISVTPLPTERSLAASAPAGAPISLPPSAPSSAPPHVGASMPTRRSAIPYRVTPSPPQVEQVRAGRLFNYVGFVPADKEMQESWSAPGDPDQLRAEFAGWDERIGGLLREVRHTFRWALYDREPLASWTHGRLTLLGDAAHPMLPHLGQGANQSI